MQIICSQLKIQYTYFPGEERLEHSLGTLLLEHFLDTKKNS